MDHQDKSSKFEVLHQKISDVDEALQQVTDQTHKKFAVVKENVMIMPHYLYFFFYYNR